jgi:hypothetical protein
MAKNYVVPMNETWDHLGTTNQAEYIFNYLKNEDIDAKTAVIEERYIDKDYLLDYAGFYARSFEPVDRCTKRIHFFSGEFDQKYFRNVLTNYDKNKIEKFGRYLGFIVLKKFKDLNKDLDPLIGRTCLVPPPKKVKNESDIRNYIYTKCDSNLFGIDLEVESLPFQAQDHAVAACATISLWIANYQLTTLFQTPRLSPIEITKRATDLIGMKRNLPNDGLTPKQMFSFFKSIDLDFEIISPSDISEVSKDIKTFIPDTVKVFIDEKIPIVAGIYLKKYDQRASHCNEVSNDKMICDPHAVVICGYRENDQGEVKALYVHDDQIGPYSRVESVTESDGVRFQKWSNEWVTDPRYGPVSFPDEPYDEVFLNALILPLYPKIRLSYRDVYIYFHEWKLYYPDYDIILHLTTIRELRKKIIESKIRNKLKILKKPLPRFMWVLSVLDNKSNFMDIVLDATSHKIREIEYIEYIE